MNRLQVVVEGHGDVEALPALAVRMLLHLRRTDWIVNKTGSRIPRGQLVDQREGTRGGPIATGLDRAVGLAKAARADALLVVVDADDDCPATFAPAAAAYLTGRMRGGVVMAVREFETWLALSLDPSASGLEKKRDAKSLLRRLVPGYKPTVHQFSLARQVNVAALLSTESRSFSKLVRDIDRITC